MRNGILFFVAASLFCLTGCDERQSYRGSVKVIRSNGQIERVELEITGSTVLKDRKQVQEVIDQLEAITIELKSAKEQFKVEEPAPNGK